MYDNEYWQQRAEQTLLNGEKLGAKGLADIRKVYISAIKELEEEIYIFYGKYAAETGLSLSEINKRLNSAELKSFSEQLKEYFDEVDRLGGYSPDTKEWLRELSAKAYVSRLEELKTRLRWIVENYYRDENLKIKEILDQVYEQSFTTSTYNIQKGIGVAYEFAMPSQRKIELATNQKWLGENYSNRIWNDKKKLIDTLSQELPKEVALGHGTRQMASAVRKKTDVKYSNCERLVRTEVNKISNDATHEAYNEVPDDILEQYQYLATLDNRTSEVCQELDGQVFYLKDAQVGVNRAPMHPNCRSTDIPYFKDMPVSERGRIATDYSRGGQAYYVPSNMTYKEWKDSLTEEQGKYFIANKKIREQRNSDKQQLAEYRKLINKANKSGMGKLFEGMPTKLNDFQNMKYFEPDKWEKYKENARKFRSK